MKKTTRQNQQNALLILFLLFLFLSLPYTYAQPPAGDGTFRISASAGETFVIRYMDFETAEYRISINHALLQNTGY